MGNKLHDSGPLLLSVITSGAPIQARSPRVGYREHYAETGCFVSGATRVEDRSTYSADKRRNYATVSSGSSI
jgi:hypothetical protein